MDAEEHLTEYRVPPTKADLELILTVLDAYAHNSEYTHLRNRILLLAFPERQLR